MRGRTTQNLASSTIRPSALLVILAVTSTMAKFSDKRTAVTWPIFMSLYFTKVLPASMPSAERNTMVMLGPSLSSRCTATPIATNAARIGMIQTGEMREGLGATTLARGISRDPALSAMCHARPVMRIPQQARIERLRRQHRENDHGHEEWHSGTGLHRHQRLQLHQRHHEGVHEHVQHRPAADEIDDPI